jgi:hypothetical protein
MSAEPCPNCGAAMADDQRYCLECGQRRGDPRVDYRRMLRATPAPAPAPEATGALSRARAGWTLPVALGTIACLLLAMAIGVLIGRSGNGESGQAAAPATQVIRVSGGTATTPASDAGAAATETGGAAKAKKAKATKAAKAKATKSAAKPSTEVKALDQATGDDYQKQSAKLPKEVGTGGKAPPKDDKPAAGGGGFEEIG